MRNLQALSIPIENICDSVLNSHTTFTIKCNPCRIATGFFTITITLSFIQNYQTLCSIWNEAKKL